MDYLLQITIIGLLSGIIGTGAGGLAAFFINGISNRHLGFILEYSAGLMTAVVCFKLVPEAFESGGIELTILGIVLGILVMILLENLLKNMNTFNNKKYNKGLLNTGIMTAVGIALHNLPEGIAVGSGFEASLSLGLTLMFAIMIHDVPEGIAMAVPMRVGGFSKMHNFFLT